MASLRRRHRRCAKEIAARMSLSSPPSGDDKSFISAEGVSSFDFPGAGFCQTAAGRALIDGRRNCSLLSLGGGNDLGSHGVSAASVW